MGARGLPAFEWRRGKQCRAAVPAAACDGRDWGWLGLVKNVERAKPARVHTLGKTQVAATGFSCMCRRMHEHAVMIRS